MSNWDTAFQGNGGDDKGKIEFASFPEGITRFRIVGGDINVRWIHWMTQHKRSVTCPGKGCPICTIRKEQKNRGEKITYNIQKKMSILGINRETKRLEVIDQGTTFFEDLRDVRGDNLEKHGDLINYDVKIKRSGTTQENTRYRIDKDEVYPLTAEDKKLLEGVDVDNHLASYFKPTTPQQIQRLLNGERPEDVFKDESVQEDTQSKTEEYEVE